MSDPLREALERLGDELSHALDNLCRGRPGRAREHVVVAMEQWDALAASSPPARVEYRVVDRDGISRAKYGPRRPPLADLHDEDLCYPGRAPHGVEEREISPWRRSHPVAALRNEQEER